MQPRSRLKSSQSKRFTKRKHEKIVLKGGLIVIIAICYVFIFSRLTYLPAFTISTINIVGTDPQTSSDIRNTVDKSLSGNYLALFSKANSFLYPKATLASAIMAMSPDIKDVKIGRSGLSSLVVSVNEKLPTAVVCASLPDLSDADLSADNCYYADNEGLIVKSAPSVSGSIFNRYFIPALSDLGSSTPLIGTFATTTFDFQSLQDFYNGVRAGNIGVEAVLVKDDGQFEMYVRTGASDGTISSSTDSNLTVVYFDQAGSLKDELANLLSFWDHMAAQARASHQPLNFDYIDVRYGSNIFYR